jgi:tetratricopeptide (TPR) repeat protein
MLVLKTVLFQYTNGSVQLLFAWVGVIFYNATNSMSMRFFYVSFFFLISVGALWAQAADSSHPQATPRKYFAALPQEQTPISAEVLMKQAIAHFDGQRYQRSIDLLNEAIDSNQHEQLVPVLYYYRAVSKMKMRQVAAAVEDYSAAIEASPYKAKYRYHRGMAYFELKKYAKAREDFERTLTMEGGDADLYVKLGFLKQQENDLHGALADYSKALEFNPQFDQPYYYRGLIYLQVLLPEKACADLHEAARLGHAQAGEKLRKYCGS